jgi:hypothetical protein
MVDMGFTHVATFFIVHDHPTTTFHHPQHHINHSSINRQLGLHVLNVLREMTHRRCVPCLVTENKATPRHLRKKKTVRGIMVMPSSLLRVFAFSVAFNPQSPLPYPPPHPRRQSFFKRWFSAQSFTS